MYARAMQQSVSRNPRRVAATATITLMCALGVWAPAGTAKPAAQSIVLPGAGSAEGIAVGTGSTFFAGDLLGGDIYRGNLQRGTVSPFIDNPAGERQAVGMSVDEKTGYLFVAGGQTGQAYVYDTRTGATVATYQLADPATGPLINDVAITKDGAWFTDSLHAQLFFIPIGPRGALGPSSMLMISGPAAAIVGGVNLNGIVASPGGSTLIVAHTANAALYTVDQETGVSTQVAGVSVPNVDGMILRGRRLWAVQGFNNQIAVIDLTPDFGAGTVQRVITSPLFQVPSTAALHGDRLAVVNAKFDTGFPPTADEYEVVIVGA
jgi:sugar lactone lactonase YvrE